MRILIDIGHPAHLNFFKNAINILKNNSHIVYITALKRGKLPELLKNEFSNTYIKFNGSHTGSKWSIIFKANILRFFQQLSFVIWKKIDVAVSCGSFTTGAIFKFILLKPNVQFDDDPERHINVALEKLTSTELFFPPIINANKKIKIMKALKEWAYLSPKYFIPSQKELKKYKIKPKEYIFIREVSVGSLNYSNQKSNLIASISKSFPSNFKVLLSLEDKSTLYLYPKNWILLNEPVENIHSLMYYSKIIVSTGDSMAREGAMLGVPSIYCGIREMAANKIMKNKGLLFHKEIKDVPHLVEEIINNNIIIEEQDKFREKLKDEWVDVTEFIVNTIKKYQKE